MALNPSEFHTLTKINQPDRLYEIAAAVEQRLDDHIRVTGDLTGSVLISTVDLGGMPERPDEDTLLRLSVRLAECYTLAGWRVTNFKCTVSTSRQLKLLLSYNLAE